MPLGARAALHREPHGLVDDEDVLVLVERDRLQEFAVVLVLGGAARDRPRLVELQGRNAHFLARDEPVVRLRALAVDAQLALADDALDMREGELRKAGDEETVDAHVGLVRLDHEGLHAGGQNLLSRRPGLSPRRPSEVPPLQQARPVSAAQPASRAEPMPRAVCPQRTSTRPASPREPWPRSLGRGSLGRRRLADVPLRAGLSSRERKPCRAPERPPRAPFCPEPLFLMMRGYQSAARAAIEV